MLWSAVCEISRNISVNYLHGEHYVANKVNWTEHMSYKFTEQKLCEA